MEVYLMKKRRIVSLVLATVMILSCALTGCSSSKNNDSKAGTESKGGAKEASAGTDKDLLTLDVYSAAANYQGKQAGWFGKVIKDKFNIELNIISPQASGDAKALYQTRCSSGNLGDIIVLDNADFQDCVKAGLIADISEDIKNSKYLKDYTQQMQSFNSNLEGDNGKKIFAIPCNMTNTSPTTYSDTEIYSSPMLPWDYFKELGTPEMKNLDDLITVLEKMQKAHPTNSTGDPSYAITLWSDWDNPSVNAGIETVNQICKWYGYEVNGSILLGKDGDMKELTDDAGTYYKMLHFLYEANQKGLIDPDSGTQDWETACTKMKQKQVFLEWYSWQTGFYNTIERGNKGDSYIHTPIADTNYYQPSDTYFGENRSWSVGSKVDAKKKARIMEFLDWLASPEGNTWLQDGIKGFNYTVGDDGKYTQTKEGENALMANLPVPQDFGGGGYNDGMCKINQWIVHANSLNPVTKEKYGNTKWSSYVKANETTMKKEWAKKYGAPNETEYLKKTGQLKIIPSVNIILPSDSTDIALIRSQCGQLVCDTSWKMIFAKNENEFKQMWSDMKKQLDGLGWKDLVAFDKQKYQKIVDARKEAMAKAQ